MDRTFLVESERNAAILAARKIMQEDGGIDIIVAAKFSEYPSPRLILASREFEHGSQIPSYTRFGQVLREIDGDQEDIPSLLLMGTDDPFVKALRSYLGQVDRSRGLHISDQAFGNRFVEDGYVFRVQ